MSGGNGIEALEDLYRRYGSLVLRRARAILGNEQAARDAMQEVFIKAMEEGGSFRGESSPVTWLYKMTTNHCLNWIRDTSRRNRLLEEHGRLQVESYDPSMDDLVAVATLLQNAPEHLREIAIYYFVDQFSHDEIASIVGVSRRTVGNRLEEFLSHVRQIFDATSAKEPA